MDLTDKIIITGARGLLGYALLQILKDQGYTRLYPLDRSTCNLTNFDAVKKVFTDIQPDYVFHLAAKVFGIGGNMANKGGCFLDNVLMNTYVIEASRLVGVKKITAMGTVAAYPEPKTEPVAEDFIWMGPPHSSENSYGHAKRAMLAQLSAYQENYGLDFAFVISTNLYGPHDKFDTQWGHVIPSLIAKFHHAKLNNEQISVWGDGSAARDFMYANDAARALFLIMQQVSGSINMGTGEKTSIRTVVDILANYLEISADRIHWDNSKPNGRHYYLLDINQLENLGFSPLTHQAQGLINTYNWYTEQFAQGTIRR